MSHQTLIGRARTSLVIAAISGSVSGALIAPTNHLRAQDIGSIGSPITALRVEGSRLLIGQASRVVTAHLTENGLQVTGTIDLKRHDLRDFATYQNITLALSEDGLTCLDDSQVLDFAPGGGQRVAVYQGQVYVAALDAGVRLLKVDTAGKLALIGTIATSGRALDVAPAGESLIWIAEDDHGVQLIDVHDPAAPRVMVSFNNLSPASIVRTGLSRLYVGYGNHLSVLDTADLSALRQSGSFTLPGNSAVIGDLVVSGNRAYVGRIANDGPDLVVLDISADPSLIAEFGSAGAGGRLALYDPDVFIGSAGAGLRRVRFDANGPRLLASWGAVNAGCTLTAPSQPQPPDGAEVAQGMVTLTWFSTCAPSAYEVRIDGQVVASETAAAYTLTPRGRHTSWQITAIDAAGHRAPSQTWTFDSAVEGWLATPAAVPPSVLIYAPPTAPDSAPTLAALGGALIIGLGVLIAVWRINSRARREQ